MRTLRFALVSSLFAACGGAKTSAPAEPGTTHETPPVAAAKSEPAATQPPRPVKVEPEPPPPVKNEPPAPPVTFQLKNEGERDLSFGITKGWQSVLFAYSGKPPKAKSILLFDSACTAACDAKDVCPVCPEPKSQKEEEAMARHETAAAGGQVAVPWDGQVLVYEKTTAGKRKCQCWRKADPAPGTYTVKACGLRAAETTGSGSKPVCVETQMTLPLPPASTITLTFPAK